MRWKIPLWPVLVLIVIGLVVGFFVVSVLNSKGCGQLVIDTFEAHSGIDIPSDISSIEYINCYYDDTEEVRIAIYRLKIELQAYLLGRNFRTVHSATDLGFQGFRMLTTDELPSGETFYFAEGSKWGNAWRYLVEKETGRLWAELDFKPSADNVKK